MDERDVFVLLTNTYGTRRDVDATTRVLVPAGPDGDCWTYAWRYAQATRFHYVEGSCWSDEVFVKAHAWVEEDTEDGVVVHELTEGYEFATSYAGVRVDADPDGYISKVTEEWVDIRGSVLEVLIFNNFPPESILSMIQPKERV